MKIFKTGDIIEATYEARTVEAIVVLASPNGRSLMIAWDDGMLGGHAGMMPILQDAEGDGFHSLIEAKPVLLRMKDR